MTSNVCDNPANVGDTLKCAACRSCDGAKSDDANAFPLMSVAVATVVIAVPGLINSEKSMASVTVEFAETVMILAAKGSSASALIVHVLNADTVTTLEGVPGTIVPIAVNIEFCIASVASLAVFQAPLPCVPDSVVSTCAAIAVAVNKSAVSTGSAGIKSVLA